MPITFLLYLTLYLCGTHLILGMLMLSLCANLNVSFSGSVYKRNMLHCFTCTFMVCKLELFCKYNCIVIYLHCFLTYWWIFVFACFFWVYTRLAILAIVCPVPCTNCYKQTQTNKKKKQKKTKNKKTKTKLYDDTSLKCIASLCEKDSYNSKIKKI